MQPLFDLPREDIGVTLCCVIAFVGLIRHLTLEVHRFEVTSVVRASRATHGHSAAAAAGAVLLNSPSTRIARPLLTLCYSSGELLRVYLLVVQIWSCFLVPIPGGPMHSDIAAAFVTPAQHTNLAVCARHLCTDRRVLVSGDRCVPKRDRSPHTSMCNCMWA